MIREWEEEMGEISGFGGDYERGCRAMVLAGMHWMDEHPNADLKYGGFTNVFGLVTEGSPDAEALTKAIMDATVTMDDGRVVRVGDEATGAMHHATIQHCFAYRKHGWDEYKAIMSRRKDE